LESKDEKSKAIQFPFENFESLHTEFQSLKARKQYTPCGTFLPEITTYNSNRNHHAVRTSSSKSNGRTTSEYSFRREFTPDPRKVSILASNNISKEILYRYRF
jgi:hypothetical protein